MKQTKLFRNKKGFNDMFILWIIIMIFVLTATFTPFVRDSLLGVGGDFDADSTLNQAQQDAVDVSTFNAFKIMVTILKLGFFNIGNTLLLPFWLSIFFQVLSTVFIFIIARNLWIGGGS